MVVVGRHGGCFQLFFVGFELSLEAQVGEDLGTVLPDFRDGGLEGPVVLAHEVGDDKGGGLRCTLRYPRDASEAVDQDIGLGELCLHEVVEAAEMSGQVLG